MTPNQVVDQEITSPVEPVVPEEHDHSKILHGRSHQTDIYPDGCLVNPNPKLH